MSRAELVKLFEGTCPNCLQIWKKSFRMPMGILIIALLLLLMHIIIIYSIYIVNNIFLTKGSAKNAARKKIWQ